MLSDSSQESRLFQGAVELGHKQLQRCRCGAEERSCLRNPDLSCTLPPRGLVQTSASSSVLGLHTLLALGSLPQISVLGEGDAKWGMGYRRKINACCLSAPNCMLVLEQRNPLTVLLQMHFTYRVSGLSQSRILHFLPVCSVSELLFSFAPLSHPIPDSLNFGK